MHRLDTLKTPLRADWQVAEDSTYTLWWPARVDKAETVMLFIPGNPGLIEYYAEFLQSIYEDAPSTLVIFGGTYSLQDQIDHKVACFDALQRQHPDARFVIMGHSIGAYFAVEVLKHRQHVANIDRLIALFPCLYDIAMSPNGRVVSRIPTGFVSNIASALSLISPPILERLVQLFTGQQGHAVKVTMSLLRGSFVRTMIDLAREEMAHVKELDHDFYKAHLDKFIIYYSETDSWAPVEQYHYMKQSYPDHGKEKEHCTVLDKS
ncbi:hypothetical protein BX666DRAFT_1863936 [Dichotomocladium elegans]|nr:hypothetical protein BX666DRAFT_1863936 [Dichotomocladium elegans]